MNAPKIKGRTVESAFITAVGVFPGYTEAIRAIFALREAGIPDTEIGVFGPDSHGKAHPSEHPSALPHDVTHSRWEEGAGVGAALGGIAGLGLGAAVALGLMSPLGPVVASGTAAALIASTAGGATIGTIIGAFAGLGIPEPAAKWYASEVEAGRVVVTVRGEKGLMAQEIIDRYGSLPKPEPEPPASVPTDGTEIYGNAVPATPY
ncbi:MAG TPA: hypothetical protein VLM40_02265 [Gemmata sp.]|nr:hypothetical protein [Gemmata sp.]